MNFTIFVLLILIAMFVFVHDRDIEFFSSSWIPAQCDLGSDVQRFSTPDMQTFPDISEELKKTQCDASTGGSTTRHEIAEGSRYDVGADDSPRYLDRVFATCDDRGQAMKGFRINTENVGFNGSIQSFAMCTDSASRPLRNTKTERTSYRSARLGAQPHVADCKGKAIVGMGFETDPNDDDMLRMRFDCANDVETIPDQKLSYFTGWSGSGDALDSYDNHSVKCPNKNTVLTRVQYYECPHTKQVTAKYECAPYLPMTPVSLENEVYEAEPVTPPGAVLTRDVSGEMYYVSELGKVFAPIGRDLKNSAERIGDMAEESIKGVGKLAKGLSGVFVGVGKGVVQGGNRLASNVVTSGKAMVNEDIGSIGTAFKSFPKVVKTKADQSAKDNLKPPMDSVKNIGTQVKQDADRFKKQIAGTFTGLVGGVPTAFKTFAAESKTCWTEVGRAWKI